MENDHYYLIGFSLKHQKIAHFRVDRLTGVETLETCFIPIEGFDVASYTNKWWICLPQSHRKK